VLHFPGNVIEGSHKMQLSVPCLAILGAKPHSPIEYKSSALIGRGNALSLHQRLCRGFT
jgi:hypothetical protein